MKDKDFRKIFLERQKNKKKITTDEVIDFHNDIKGKFFLNELIKSDPPVLQKSSGAVILTPTHVLFKEAYVLLPSHKHGSYEYPDLEVCMRRLDFNKKIDEINPNLKNTAKENCGHWYIGDILWNEAIFLNLRLGYQTLNIRQFLDFKKYLEEGIDGRVVLNASKKPVHQKVLKRIYNEIFKVRLPFRGEALDARFKKYDGILHINYNHKIKNWLSFIPACSEPLEFYLDNNGWIDISTHNRQGLPTKMGNDYYFFKPVDKCGTVFYVTSDRATLGCNLESSVSASGIGVRPIKIFEG